MTCWKLLDVILYTIKKLTISKLEPLGKEVNSILKFESLHPHYIYSWVSVLYVLYLILDTQVLETNCHLLATFELIPNLGMSTFKYRKARLYIPSPEAKRPEWYIQYWAWDVTKGKLKKFTDFQVNKLDKSEAQKKRWAQHRCAEINRLLDQGYHYNPEKKKFLEEQEKFKKFKSSLPVKDLFDEYIKSIERKNYSKERLKTNYHLNGYKSKSKKFSSWLSNKSMGTLSADLIEEEHIEEFLRYLYFDLDFSMRTRDNYLVFLKSFFSWCVEEKIIVKNPTKRFKKRNKKLGRNIAYNAKEQKELLSWMKNNRPDFYFLSLFIYYTFIRVEECALLKIENINQYQSGVIRIPEEVSKTGFLRNVTIPKQLMELLKEFKVLNYPSHFFLFSNNLEPGPDYYPAKYFGNRYGKVIRPKFKWMTKDHTLYSWKHTGIVELKRAGIEDAFIMTQSGHRTVSGYQTYLKSLGIEKNERLVNGFPSAGS